jgi:hypothetical protein
MRGCEGSLEELCHDLDETTGVIEILGRAGQELRAIIDWDEAVRQNPPRQRQLQSICEQLYIARGKRKSLAQMFGRLHLVTTQPAERGDRSRTR